MNAHALDYRKSIIVLNIATVIKQINSVQEQNAVGIVMNIK